jgi:hypothetical protein
MRGSQRTIAQIFLNVSLPEGGYRRLPVTLVRTGTPSGIMYSFTVSIPADRSPALLPTLASPSIEGDTCDKDSTK